MSEENSSSSRRRPGKRRRRRTPLTAPGAVVVAALIAAAAAITGAVINSDATVKPPSASPSARLTPSASTQSCATSPNRASIERPVIADGVNYTVRIHFLCAPEPGQSYAWTGELRNVGQDRHTVWFWTRGGIPEQPQAGQTIEVGGSLSHSLKATTYLLTVLSLPTGELPELDQHPLPTGGILPPLPQGYSIVSNQQPLTRTG